jgi:hypothetical protein
LWLYLSPVVVMIAFGLWVCARRLAEVRAGRLVPVSGWTHDDGQILSAKHASSYPIVIYAIDIRIIEYRLKIDNRTYTIDRKLYSRIRPERNNTVFFTPWTKRIINVAPTP